MIFLNICCVFCAVNLARFLPAFGSEMTAVRNRQSPQWAVELTDGGDFAIFLSLFETKVSAKKGVVQSAEGCNGKVHLQWKRSVSYSGAYAWISSVVSDKFAWRLVDPGSGAAEVVADEVVPPQVSQQHLMPKALFTIRQKGQKRPLEYISQKKVLGSGTFSQVQVARPAQGCQDLVAVKKFKSTADASHQLEELYFLERISCPFVIKVLDVVQGDSPGSLAFVFPMAKMTLGAHIAQTGGLALQKIQRMAKHIAQGTGVKKLVYPFFRFPQELAIQNVRFGFSIQKDSKSNNSKTTVLVLAWEVQSLKLTHYSYS